MALSAALGLHERMALFGRPDGVLAERVPLVRRFMPFLMRRRNESLVWFEHDVAVDRALAFAESFSGDRGVRLTFFHLVLRSLARVFDEFPRLNRYVVGRRLYQRTDIAISFSGKEAFETDAPLYVRKRVFDPREPLVDLARSLGESVKSGRSGEKTQADREMRILAALPRLAIDGVVAAGRALDYFNLLPARMIRDDPLYASAFVANLGSVGIAGAYHHLYEYGTIPIFVVVGAYRAAPVVRADGQVAVERVATLKYTYDERIEDGFYCARAVARMKELLEAPERLEV
jgi:2-oxoacid dehydrogenase/acyltransferase catalytic subunit